MIRSDEKIVVTLMHRTHDTCDKEARFRMFFDDVEKTVWEKHFGDIDFEFLENNGLPYSQIEIVCGDQKEVFDALRLGKVTTFCKQLRGIK